MDAYSAVKPASPIRTWLMAAALLGVATTLAVSMSARGLKSGTWSDRIEPVGWNVSFRSPPAFVPADSPPEHFASTYRFLYPSPNGTSLELVFWRLRVPEGATTLQVCREVLDTAESWVNRLLGPPRTRIDSRLGGKEALEIHSPSAAMIVRATLLNDGWAFAVSIRAVGAPVDEVVYRLFDMTCRSVRVLSN